MEAQALVARCVVVFVCFLELNFFLLLRLCV
jgi:hypothetical protein